MKSRRLGLRGTLITLAASAATLVAVTAPAHASSPYEQVLYQLPSNATCLKAASNCAMYEKAAALPDGRLIAGWEESTVASSGSANGQTIPIYKSDDNGTTWQHLTAVPAPAYASSNSAYANYVSAWTNPYFYVLPHAVDSLSAGTLLMAAVVSGDDQYYLEHKAANPNWVPSNDGDRENVAIGLYSSTDNGVSWNFLNIITTGGWQGGSAGAIGKDISAANTYAQVDPVWEPYLLEYNGQLIAYFSDENDYTGYDTTTGALTIDPKNATTPDADTQIIAHRTWDGSSSSPWSLPVVDVPGTTVTNSSGYTEIGGGRPGMANVVQTTDGKWMMTFEYWGGGDNVRYKIASSPLDFFTVGGATGTGVNSLPVTSGSPALAQGGSPVLVRLPDGRLLYNAAGSGNVWTDESGSSTGAWTQQYTGMPSAYSRSLTYIPGTGRVEIIGGADTIDYADVDFGDSTGPYYNLVNENSGQDLGVWDADLLDGQNVVQWPGNGSNDQEWHVTSLGNGYDVLLDDRSGRALGIYEASTSSGGKAVQWVQNQSYDQQWQLIAVGSRYELLNRNSGLALTVSGSLATEGAQVVQEPYTGAASQLWSLNEVSS